jgi:hypothetical protein
LHWLIAPPRPDPRSSLPIEIPLPTVPEPVASGAPE